MGDSGDDIFDSANAKGVVHDRIETSDAAKG
jgi:hypothetical protein